MADAVSDESLLPYNATLYERALEGAVSRVSSVDIPAREVWNADACPVELLPWLAWALSVDFWDSNWEESQKRAAIRTAFDVQRVKGTVGAVETALASLGWDVTIQEWFNQSPPGKPYTFDVIIDVAQSSIDEAGLAKVMSYISATKNLRSHVGVVRPSLSTSTELYSAAVCTQGEQVTIKYRDDEDYSDGEPALDLMTDAAIYGEASTIAGLDALDSTLSSTMPKQNWGSLK
ncbi:phage tail protein I [Paraburkholderia sp. BR10936]|uniref:phage tail protein I n=1 Tax=Paraburkholderia sp. BR10936 TaxID=3236993 RepID=UPI0034D19AD0